MSDKHDKDALLLDHITKELLLEGDNATDLANLIGIILGQNDKDALLTEINEIYEDTFDTAAFVDWVWNLYKGGDDQGHEEAHSEISDQKDKKMHTGPNHSAEKTKQPDTKDEGNTNLVKRSRPAIYDEYERNQKLENVQNVNRNAKKAEKKNQNNNKSNSNDGNARNNRSTTYSGNTSRPNVNGGKPQPPPGPKQESKPSILDRIIKPGEKGKTALTTGKNNTNNNNNQNFNTKNQNKPNLISASSKEKIIKKVKPNPEFKQPNSFAKVEQKSGGQTAPSYKHELRAAPSAEEDDQHQEEEEVNANQAKIKVKCRNWPACKNKVCPFHHPTEQCQKFPACRFGDQCLYVHPAIPCKFGAQCQRPNCAYVHPRGPPMQYYGFGGQPQKKGPKPHFAGHAQAGNENTTEEVQIGEPTEDQLQETA